MPFITEEACMPTQNQLAGSLDYENKTDAELLILLKNCHERFDSDPSKAKKIITAVNHQFKKRQKVASSIPYLYTIRQVGVLKAFGYEVGDTGVTDDQKRQFILDVVVELEIPPIDQGSPDEFKRLIASFGEPNSRSRIRRLTKLLEHYVNEFGNYKYGKRARNHWLNDIKYLESKASKDTYNIYSMSY
jgi:hypothetical protein